MIDSFAAAAAETQGWFERVHAGGWLTTREMERFLSLEQRTPADLFTGADRRPLVVAFFGGTGVGKSSLLNRLAREKIAQTGVERPTSREVTIYVHESVELAKLPAELPVEHVHIKRHGDDARRDVLWIDAPDIDSAEESNRQLALAWLPHIDLLVYVVSPERYRDDVGWRVLRERGGKHGWMFVINRWDEGDARQKDDFAGMLREAGFDAPLLLCTSCAIENQSLFSLPSAEEFSQIEEAIQALLAEHGVRELERLGHRARLMEMRGAINDAAQRLGDDDRWARVHAAREVQWRRTRDALVQGLEWPIRAAAGRLAVRQQSVLSSAVRRAVAEAKSELMLNRAKPEATKSNADPSAGGPDVADSSEITRNLWDEWTSDKLSECVDALEVEVRRTGIAAGPLRSGLDSVADVAQPTVTAPIEQRLREALARPGTRLQRALRRVTGFLMTLLPVLALLWVAYNVVTGYYRASRGQGGYLGSDFAVSSVLLIAVAWAVPFVCDRLLRPSLERAALSAMRQGLANGLDVLGDKIRGAILDTARLAQRETESAREIVNGISRLAIQPIDATKPALSRLLVSRRSTAVGAHRA